MVVYDVYSSVFVVDMARRLRLKKEKTGGTYL